MKLPDRLVLADASGRGARLASVRGGVFEFELSSAEGAVESFADLLRRLCEKSGAKPADIGAFAMCVGPGSILGTRVASAAICAIAEVSGAKILVWDILQAGARVLAKRKEKAPFALFAPSRKGFANCLTFDGSAVLGEREIELSRAIPEDSLPKNRILLDQKKTAEPFLSNMPRVDFSMEQIWDALRENPKLLEEAKSPPNAKSLSKREYVKWKAPALI